MNYTEMLIKANVKLEKLEAARDTAYDILYKLEDAEPYDDDAFEEQNEICGNLDNQYNDLLNLVDRLTAVVDALKELHTEYRMDELEELGK